MWCFQLQSMHVFNTRCMHNLRVEYISHVFSRLTLNNTVQLVWKTEIYELFHIIWNYRNIRTISHWKWEREREIYEKPRQWEVAWTGQGISSPSLSTFLLHSLKIIWGGGPIYSIPTLYLSTILFLISKSYCAGEKNTCLEGASTGCHVHQGRASLRPELSFHTAFYLLYTKTRLVFTLIC